MSATPRPWLTQQFVDGHGEKKLLVYASDRGHETSITGWLRADDAELIVRAVNAYEPMQDDLYAIARAFDLPALPYSGHEAVQRDILPAIERMKNARDALVEALSRFCTNDWADEFRANGYGNCAGCGVGVDDIHVDAEHPSVDHGPRCAVLQGRAALRQAGALE